MTFQSRWWLPMLMAGSLVVACSSGGGGGGTTDASTTTDTPVTDATTDTTSPTDTGGDARTDARTDTSPTDRPATGACASVTDISSMMPGSDGAIHVTGNNESGAPMSLGALPDTCVNGGRGGEKGSVVVYSYTMRAAGTLRVSTTNAGTSDAMFDTVVAVLSTCSVGGAALACNDDTGDAAPHRLHSRAQTSALMAGQRVFIVVGGYGMDAASASTGDFELTVQEAPPTPVGGACSAGAVCVANATCVANVGSTTMGTCLANGANRGICRTSGTACDTGLTCTVEMPSADANGQCLPPSMVGQPCGQLGVCVMSSVCPNFLIGGSSSMGDAGVVDGGATDAGSGMDGGTTPAVTRVCVAPVAEMEPNNTPAMPQAAVTSSTVFRGALTAGDTDCYSVTVPAGTSIFAETSDFNGTCNLGDGADTVLRVYRMGETMPLAENDDAAGRGLCSTLNSTATPVTALTRVAAGTYSVCVSAYSMPDAGTPADPIMSYYLTIGLR
ncbi:MAG: hypothetical protein U0326_08260 [Polyangiales bacterium]